MAPPPTLSTIRIDQISENAALFTYNQPKISNAFTIQQYIDMRDALLWALGEAKINVIVQYVISRCPRLATIIWNVD
jgi:Delta3-Delta2-enoyl-CoA isomerase